MLLSGGSCKTAGRRAGTDFSVCVGKKRGTTEALCAATPPPQYAPGVCLPYEAIDRDIITHFARAGTLYEDAKYHNAVFVGTDEHGVSRHAQKRSTNSQGKSFKLNVAGSDARYSFHHLGDDGDLYVFEAPIDLLSYITLHPENWQQHSYVACCGTSYEPVRWILTRMEAPQMVSLCLDHDNAGDQGCERMAKQISSEFGFPTRRLVPEQKDWNEDLCALREAPRRQRMEMEMR